MNMSGKIIGWVTVAACLLAAASRAAPAGESVNILEGFENYKIKNDEKGRFELVENHATEGKKSLHYTPNWRFIASYAKGNFLDHMAQPPAGSYHDIRDWFYQRSCNMFDSALRNKDGRQDWSGYELLRFDIFSEKSPAVIVCRVFDASGPKIPAHYLGLRSNLSLFKVPQDKQVTCEFPLAEMARVAEMDLSKMTGLVLRVNGYEGDADIFVDNIRLVTKEAAAGDAKFSVVKMEGEPKPYARPVIYKLVKRDPEKMKRESGAIEKLGPVTVYSGVGQYSSGAYACGGGHFGGSGHTYFQSLRRGCVAYDNKRLLVLMGAGPNEAKAIGERCQGGGVWAMASFDGGATWGGLKPGENLPWRFRDWYWRATASSDANGDVYHIGTENCSSYHEGYGVLFRRLAMTGEGWEDDRVSLLDQNLRKCPGDARAWRLASGRIWATWKDGWGGCVAKHSDDDGYTWAPCKDASKPLPRPFYEPNLEDLKKPPEQRPQPPKEILPWPGTPVAGSVLLPCKGQVAVLKEGWQVHDGKAWGPVQKLPMAPPGSAEATVAGERVFLAGGGSYDNKLENEKRGALKVAVQDGDSWKEETLEPGDIGDVILTASGEAVFCFYVKAVKEGDREAANEVHCRRWKDGKWGESELVAKEDFRINRLASPIISAPNYAAIWWDERMTDRKKPTVVRFARVPNK
ncbi:MAG: hypothetical protein V2A79_12845 [Planctomycetota bacterium]